MAQKLTYDEVKKHNTPGDLWVIISGKVYDLTDFAPDHPGGEGVVTEQAGKDCTQEFLHAHPESIMTLTLGKDGLAKCLIGEVDMSTVPAKDTKRAPSVTPAAPEGDEPLVPPLQAVLNLHDMEAIAQRKMNATGKKQAWDYYSSGADDELTYNENVTAFQRIWLRPRVMVDVAEVATEASLLGSPSDFPVYLSAVAMCGMGHEDGECAWMTAAKEAGVPFMVPNLSSKPLDDILGVKAEGQDAWYQIYVNPDKSVVEDQLKKLEAAGVKNLCITVDSAVPGKRERDLRNKIAMQLGQQAQQGAAAKGTSARKAGNYANRDPALNWSDLEWFRTHTTIPLVLKGIQTAEDAVIAAESGCVRGIILSNHGGRNLDTSRSGIEVLPEVMAALRAKGLQDKLEVYVDGGVRRGTDILKAIALGAKGVGLGKPAVYAMSAYGSDGIVKMLSVLKEELIKSMQLVGAATLADLKPEMVDASAVTNHSDVARVPPSPYVRQAAVQPAQPKTATELRAEIAKMQVLLEAVEGPQVPTTPAGQAGLFFKALLAGVASTIYATNFSTALHRTALLMYAYLITAALGSLVIFLGPDCFNGFQNFLDASPVYTAIDYYVLLAGVIHAAIAGYQAKNKLSFILSNPMKNGVLSLTGTAILYLAYTQYVSFRADPSAIPTLENGQRDYYRYEVGVFADITTVVAYLVGVAAIMLHLQVGWPKTVLKMGLGEAERKVVADFGVALTYPVGVALLVAPVMFHMKSAGYSVL
eukprot:TRINITY_DN7080_c0_g1_i1.p1 TRINITY_DN7080_c0_g1~~TRINITY_DN7080_c0_g1_i1.p1  ORF type:complete len:772 (+),score=379.67 TRINITY_DN7080_c0_g1_i1:49-2316(+)